MVLHFPINKAWFQERNLRCRSNAKALTSEEVIYLMVTFATHPDRLTSDQIGALACRLFGHTPSDPILN